MIRQELVSYGIERRRLQEKCGIAGVINFHNQNITPETYNAIRYLQHRGHDGAGIASLQPDKTFEYKKGIGLIHEVFQEEDLDNRLFSTLAIAHTRYATIENTKGMEKSLQPFVFERNGRRIALVHNGNIPQEYVDGLKSRMPEGLLQTEVDSELLGWLIMLAQGETWSEKVKNGLSEIPGAFSLIIATDDGELIGLKDRFSVRKLAYAHTPNGFIFASESIAFSDLNTSDNGEVRGGEMIVAKDNVITKHTLFPATPKGCFLDWSYISDAYSMEAGITNYTRRFNLGVMLAIENPDIKADLVFGVPDTGIPFGLGFAHQSGIPYVQVLALRRFGKDNGRRSFIGESPDAREEILDEKYKPSPDIKGKRLLEIEDTVIRGATLRKINWILRRMGALWIGSGIAAPLFKDICEYGVDISKKEELIVYEKSMEGLRERTVGEVAKEVNSDKIIFLSKEGLAKGHGVPLENLCTHCLTSEDPFQEYVDKVSRSATI